MSRPEVVQRQRNFKDGLGRTSKLDSEGSSFLLVVAFSVDGNDEPVGEELVLGSRLQVVDDLPARFGGSRRRLRDADSVAAVEAVLDVGDGRTRIPADVANDLPVKTPVDDLLADDRRRVVDAQLRRNARGWRRRRSPMTVMELFGGERRGLYLFAY